MSMPAERKTAAAPVLKGIVNERESQLRLVTSVRLRWMAVLGQLGSRGPDQACLWLSFQYWKLPDPDRDVGVA